MSLNESFILSKFNDGLRSKGTVVYPFLMVAFVNRMLPSRSLLMFVL